MKFDLTFTKEYKKSVIDYGIIHGNNTFLLIKSGNQGTKEGHQNKYLKMAHNINQKYGYTVVCCSNPFDWTDSLNQATNIIDKYARYYHLDDYTILYIGTSAGGTLGACFAHQYPKIKKMLLINMPLFINWHRIKNGLSKYNNNLVFVYGTQDPSYKFVELLRGKNVVSIDGATHNFKGMDNAFASLVELII